MSATFLVILDGNSLMGGIGDLLSSNLGSSWSVVSIAVGGQTTEQILSDCVAQVTANDDQTKLRRVYVVWEGTNSILFNDTAQQAYDSIVQVCLSIKALGFEVICLTAMHRGDVASGGVSTLPAPQQATHDARIVQYNNLLRDNMVRQGITLVDTQSDPRLVDNTNEHFFNSDHTHLNSTGQGVPAALIARGLNPMGTSTRNGFYGGFILTGDPSYASQIASDGAVALWRLASTADSIGSHTLTLVNSPSQTQSGAIKNDTNASMRVTGTEYAQFADASDLRFVSGDSLSIECWIRPSALPSLAYVVQKGAIGNAFANYSIRTVGTEIDFYYNGAGGFHVRGSVGAGLEVGKWYHLVVTYTFGGTTIAMYVNGVAQTNVLTFGTWDGDAPSVFTDGGDIGFCEGSTSLPFSGWIDEVAVYRTILTAGQVLSHYNLGAKTLVSLSTVTHTVGTTVLWAFDTFMNPASSDPSAADMVALEVNAAGLGYISPATKGAGGGNGTVAPTYAVVSVATNAWRILTDPVIPFGSDHYLRVPSSGTLA